jgi:hypothetical protein
MLSDVNGADAVPPVLVVMATSVVPDGAAPVVWLSTINHQPLPRFAELTAELTPATGVTLVPAPVVRSKYGYSSEALAALAILTAA